MVFVNNLNKKNAISIIVGVSFFFSGKAFSQKETSCLLFGIPQRTHMYGNYDSENAAVIAQTHLPDEHREINKLPSYNFAFGFLMMKSYTKNIALRFGAYMSPHEQYYKTYLLLEDRHIKSSIRLKYVKIPIAFQYNYLVRQKTKMFLSVGPELNVLISANGTLPFFGHNKYFPTLDMIDPAGAYHTLSLGGMVMTGGEFKLDDHIAFVLAAYFDGTFTPVQKESFVHLATFYVDKVFEYPNVTLRSKSNIAIGLMVGLSFTIKQGVKSQYQNN